MMMGAEALETGIDVGVSSWTRLAPNTLPALAKGTANYANSALIKMQAMLDGYADGVALDESGLLSEGSGQNLFLVRDNVDLHAVARLVGAAGHHPRHRADAGEGPGLRGARNSRFRASSCISPTKRSSAAPRSRSRRSARSTRSSSATASAGRSPRRCNSAFSRSCAAIMPDTHGWLTPVGQPWEPDKSAIDVCNLISNRSLPKRPVCTSTIC